MKYPRLIKPIAAMAMLCGGAGALPAAVIVSVDMDTVTPGIQATRLAGIGEVFTIALVMTSDVDGVSSYGVSVNFDNAELTLTGAPASTELLPAGFAFNLSAGVSSESQGAGEVRTFEAATFGLGPVSSAFTIGTISFTATAPVTDGSFDVTPGLFNTGIDGIFDNASGDKGPTASFVAGRVDVVPEPATGALLALGAIGLFASRRKRSQVHGLPNS